MGSFSVDDSQWPLVRMRLDGKQSDDDVARFIARLEEFLGRGEPYVGLVEVGSFSPDFAHVKQLARWTQEHASETEQAVAGMALVMPSDAFRLLLSAFFLVTPMPCPFHASTDSDEAVDWLTGQARERGIAISL